VTAALYSTSAFLLAFFLLKEVRFPYTINSRWILTVETKTAPVITPRSVAYHKGKQYNGLSTDPAVPDMPSVSTECSPLVRASKGPPISLRTLLTPRVLAIILVYALLGITDVSFIVLQPVFLSTPISRGGLGMSPSTIGVCLAAFGIANGAVSILFFAPLNRRFGTKNMLKGGIAAFLGCFPLFPVMNSLARVQGGLGPAVWIVFVLQLAMATLIPMAFSKPLLLTSFQLFVA
jgi:hypothetical protein